MDADRAWNAEDRIACRSANESFMQPIQVSGLWSDFSETDRSRMLDRVPEPTRLSGNEPPPLANSGDIVAANALQSVGIKRGADDGVSDTGHTIWAAPLITQRESVLIFNTCHQSNISSGALILPCGLPPPSVSHALITGVYCPLSGHFMCGLRYASSAASNDDGL